MYQNRLIQLGSLAKTLLKALCDVLYFLGPETGYYHIAGNVGGENSWRKRKFSIMAGFNLADLQLYISYAHSFRLGTHTCKMENEADVAEFVLESVVRGYHVYQTIWEVQQVKVVGHVLRLFSSTCMVFLKRTGAILCRVIGSRTYTKVTKKRHLHMVLNETLDT